MTLAINVTTHRAMVFAADRRQTYTNKKGHSRIGSESVTKIHQLGRKVGAVVAGVAFLPDKGELREIGTYLSEFRRSHDCDALSIEEVAEKLERHLLSPYKEFAKGRLDAAKVRKELEAQGAKEIVISDEGSHLKLTYKDAQGKQADGTATTDPIQVLVGGYQADNRAALVQINIPGMRHVHRDSRAPDKKYGATWIGQADVVTRIIKGYDPRVSNLPLVTEAVGKIGIDQVQNQLNALEYLINWGTMAVQDAIDFGVLAIQMSADIQRFSDGVLGDPGSFPGVGRQADVVVLTPEHGFRWITERVFRVGDEQTKVGEQDTISSGSEDSP